MGQLKALLVLAIFVVGAYAAYIFFPPYMANYQFEDDLKTEVRFMQNSGKADDDIKAEIIKKAMDEGFPLSPQQIKISRFNKTITVQVDYSVHVDVPGYSTDLQFHPSATNTLAL